MSKALYRKYRSKSLDEVIGQTHVTDVLRRSLAKGRVAHAYLLTGPRGVGKTSIARILAYEINKLPYDENATNLDIIEIDAASNNGVEDVRDLREKVQIAPVSANKKVYIIDEVHMLSKQAFNALLKTLEEPPAHVVFILATTDADKLPATIISRTQRYSFRSITPNDAAIHLKSIAQKEKITIDDDALELIAVHGDGSFRDSISLLDQLRGLADDDTVITRKLIEQSLGLAPDAFIEQLITAYEAKDLKAIVTLLDDSDKNGIQPTIITSQLIHAVRLRIAEKPQLIQLLDQLLDVAKSSQPHIKLLTTLAAHAVPKTKSAALSAASPVVSAPLAELEKQATKAKPSYPPTPKAQTNAPQPATSSPAKTKVKTLNSTPPKKQKSQVETTAIDWEKLIDYTRSNYVAIYSVLTKCHHHQSGNTLTLYTGTSFWKKKLDDSKHRINLIDALTNIGAGELMIETIGTPPPPKDSTAAAVAAIMGGGEEVSVGE
ncbi:MAG TPA: DNA polymerase III subunit gamma/tau [Candidatus Saccharimonadales bacterium]|nr:DNA polymerase III subunit gamma/tau [Candidatus Saccharimonadales bacterium]